VVHSDRLAAVAARLVEQPGLVQQFEALEHLLLVPMSIVEAEADPQPLGAHQRALRARRRARPVGPFLQARQDLVAENGRPARAPILPWEIVVPAAPGGAPACRRFRMTGEREVADGDDVRTGIARLRMTAAVAECVELLHVAQLQPGLLLHPGPQADLERAVLERRERSKWKTVGAGAGIALVAHHEHHRLVAVHGKDCRVQSNLDARCLSPRRFRSPVARAALLDCGLRMKLDGHVHWLPFLNGLTIERGEKTHSKLR